MEGDRYQTSLLSQDEDMICVAMSSCKCLWGLRPERAPVQGAFPLVPTCSPLLPPEPFSPRELGDNHQERKEVAGCFHQATFKRIFWCQLPTTNLKKWRPITSPACGKLAWIMAIYANTCTNPLAKYRMSTQNHLDTRVREQQQQMLFSLRPESSEHQQLRFARATFK